MTDRHLVLLVCHRDDREEAARDAAKLSGRPEDAVPEFFSVPLTDGKDITHYLACAPMRQESLTALPYLATKYPRGAWALRADTPDLDAWLATLGLGRKEESFE